MGKPPHTKMAPVFLLGFPLKPTKRLGLSLCQGAQVSITSFRRSVIERMPVETKGKIRELKAKARDPMNEQA